jgi:hypothetical protein
LLINEREGKTTIDDNVNTVIRDSDLQRIQENPDDATVELPFKNTMMVRRQSSMMVKNTSKASIGAERKSISINRNNNTPRGGVSEGVEASKKILQATHSQGLINQKASSIDLINKGSNQMSVDQHYASNRTLVKFDSNCQQ